MSKDSRLSTWAKWTGGVSLLTIALAAGTLGLVLNVSHGLEAGLAAGIAFGLADGAKVIIPLVAGLIGWTRQMRITAVICVTVSLWSAVNVYLDGAGAAILAKHHASETYADKAKAIAELEAEAARLSSLAAEEGKRKGCGPSCRALNESASAARQRPQEARTAKAEAKPVEISGLAAMIVMASGANTDGIARGIGAVKAMLFLTLIEVLVWLSVPAMALLSQARIREVADDIIAIEAAELSTPVASVVYDVANPVHAVNSDVETPSPARFTSAFTSSSSRYYVGRLERDYPAIAKRVAAGEISIYKACIEAGIRKAPAKANKWTRPETYMQKADA